jgi:hypothetical protein
LESAKEKIFSLEVCFCLKNAVFWDVAPCSVQLLAHAGSSLAEFSTLKMEAKRRFKEELHGATSDKTAFFIVTAVKTSNLTCF